MKKTVAAIMIACSVVFAAAIPAGAHAAEVQILSTYEIDFSSATADRVNADFTASYMPEGGYPRLEKVDAEEGHWFLEDGGIVRKNDIAAGDVSTTQVAVLTYKGKLYTNFRATVEYKQGASTVTWAALAFRQLYEGYTAADDGGGAECFVQRDGKATVWGRYCGSESPIESAADPSYDRDARHSMTVEVIGNALTLSVDGAVRNTHTLPASFYYEGYLSLLSINNDSVFYRLKIEELSEPEFTPSPKHEPIPSADTEDALGNMAEEGDFSALRERGSGDLPAAEGGLGGTEIGLICGACAIVVLGAAVLAVLLILKKKKRKE